MVQFPAPLPFDEILRATSFEQLVTCLFITLMAVCLLSMLLPHQFVALFKIAFPWMPDKLEQEK
jgi:hypothetical protein